MSLNLAPVVLFVYNRPQHTRLTLEALSKNSLAAQSVLYVFADGAKEKAGPEDLRLISDVKTVVKEKKWCKEVHLVERERNMGLAANIVNGVTQVVNEHGKIIVLEDDIITSPGFLKFMNDALVCYENSGQVMHVSGYMFPVRNKLDSLFFLKQTYCWGWATWKRAWQNFNGDASYLCSKIKERNSIYEFDLAGSSDFYKQLEGNVKGNLTTWAVKWYASVFLADGLALHAGTSMINNIGFDNSGANCVSTGKYHNEKVLEGITVSEIPLKVSERAIIAIASFFRAKEVEPKKFGYFSAKLVGVFKMFDECKIRYKKYILKKSQQIFIEPDVKIKSTTIVENRFGGSIRIGHGTELLEGVCVLTYGGNIQIGKNCSVNPYTIIYGHGGVIIGDNVLIAGHCMVIPNNHIYQDRHKLINQQGNDKKGIIIEDDVWIGHGCSILDGVIIGKGAVIAAGSVVNKSITPYSVVAGIPARVVGSRN